MQELAKQFTNTMEQLKDYPTSITFEDFLFFKMKHLEKFYGTQDEFKTHLLSGEVTMPIKWLLEMVHEFHYTILPSLFQIGDKVSVCFSNEEGMRPMSAKVLSAHFYAGKVKYDLEIPIYEEESTRIYNIDGCFVKKPVE